MKRIPGRVFIVLCSAVLVFQFSADARAGGLEAGAASVDVSPDKVEGIGLAGYEPRRSDGLHDPITARCVVIADGETTIALVALDLLGVLYGENVRMAKAAEEKSGVPAGNIFVHSIHTHSAPDLIGLWGGSSDKYKEKLADGVAECVAKAAAEKRPAIARFASGAVEGKNINRRHPDGGKVDKTMAVMEFADADGKTIATIVNFACHPVVLGKDNLKITADYVYFLRKKLEEGRGGETLFFSRDIGDANPPAIHEDVYDRGGGTFDMARELGESLADDAVRFIETAAGGDVKIRAGARKLEFEVENPQFLQLMKSGLFKRKVKDGKILTAVSIIDLGPAQIVTLPGEPLTAVGEEALAQLPGPVKFLFCQTHDGIGYIVPPEEWTAGRYEESVSVGRAFAPALVEALGGLSEELFEGRR